jgi:hypothetical protein
MIALRWSQRPAPKLPWNEEMDLDQYFASGEDAVRYLLSRNRDPGFVLRALLLESELVANIETRHLFVDNKFGHPVCIKCEAPLRHLGGPGPKPCPVQVFDP